MSSKKTPPPEILRTWEKWAGQLRATAEEERQEPVTNRLRKLPVESQLEHLRWALLRPDLTLWFPEYTTTTMRTLLASWVLRSEALLDYPSRLQFLTWVPASLRSEAVMSLLQCPTKAPTHHETALLLSTLLKIQTPAMGVGIWLEFRVVDPIKFLFINSNRC